MRTDGSQQKISGSERGSESDPLSRNNQGYPKYVRA